MLFESIRKSYCPSVLKLAGLVGLLGVLIPLVNPVDAAEFDYLRDPLYRDLDRSQSARAAMSVQDALETQPSGNTFTWSHDSQALQGGVTPIRTFKIRSGHYCREYREVLHLGDSMARERQRIACRLDPGRWVPLNG